MVIVAAGLSLLTVPVAAHHSFNAEFNTDKPARLQGRVTTVDWINPHAFVSLEVTDGPATGATTVWMVELSPPNVLMRNGLKKDDLVPGTDVMVDGFLARDGHALLGSTSITLRSTGRVINTPPANFVKIPAARFGK
jgi:hypothetical protein